MYNLLHVSDVINSIIKSRAICRKSIHLFICIMSWLILWRHCCHMGTAIQGWASECPDVKNYKWWLNPVWYRMLYSCTHMTTVGVKGLKLVTWCWQNCINAKLVSRRAKKSTLSLTIPLRTLAMRNFNWARENEKWLSPSIILPGEQKEVWTMAELSK